MSIQQVEKSIAELQSILAIVQRPDNKLLIQTQLKTLNSQLQLLKVQIPKIPEKVQIQPIKTQTPSFTASFTTLSKYSYDQQGKKFKIYFSLENIGKECKQDQIKVSFTSNSLQLKIFGYKGVNYIFASRRLAGTIDPQSSKFILKNNTLILSLTKTQTKHWDGINYKQSIIDKQTQKKEKDEDPNASLMNLMKKMYDQGDDNMKKTIAQTWAKSREQKGGKPGFDGPMPSFGEPSFRPYGKK